MGTIFFLSAYSNYSIWEESWEDCLSDSSMLMFTVIAHVSHITYGGSQSRKWWTLLPLIKTTMNDSNYNYNICPRNYIVCWTEMKLEYLIFWSTFSFQWKSFSLDTWLVSIFLYTKYCRDSIYKCFPILLFLFKSLFYPLEILHLKKNKNNLSCDSWVGFSERHMHYFSKNQ